jgi:Bacterial regulatory proteins, luxR family
MRTKEIAAELGIAPSTIDSYIADAVRILGARDRRDAAAQLDRHEAASAPNKSGPNKSGGTFPRVVPPLPTEPVAEQPDTTTDWRSYLPIRPKGGRHNDLNITLRIGWIVGLAVLMLMAFGQLSSGLQVVSDLLGARSAQ